jgi:uncharacterized protein with HEPN domain
VQVKTQKANPHIPWAKVIGLRNVVVHEYFGLNGQIIWDIIKKDITPLKRDLKLLVQEGSQ